MAEPWVVQARNQRYGELLQQTGSALIGAAPQGWRRIDLIAKLAEGVQDFGLAVIMADFSYVEDMDLPAQVAQALAELRKLMYEPELGAWLSVRYVINAPGEFRIFYNYEHDPLWDPPIPPEVFRRDLAAHPRPAEKIPGWLRHLVEQAEACAERAARPQPYPPRPVGDPRPAPLWPADHRDLRRKIADLLVMRAPAEFEQIRVTYRATGNHEHMVGSVLGIDGRLRAWEAPRELPGCNRRPARRCSTSWRCSPGPASTSRTG